MKKQGFPHMVKEELLPFSPLLPPNVQGDSTVTLPLTQLVSNPARRLPVGFCPRNYMYLLCLSVAIQDFQLYSNLLAKSKLFLFIFILFYFIETDHLQDVWSNFFNLLILLTFTFASALARQ